jgi:hypothetical protein
MILFHSFYIVTLPLSTCVNTQWKLSLADDAREYRTSSTASPCLSCPAPKRGRERLWRLGLVGRLDRLGAERFHALPALAECLGSAPHRATLDVGATTRVLLVKLDPGLGHVPERLGSDADTHERDMPSSCDTNCLRIRAIQIAHDVITSFRHGESPSFIAPVVLVQMGEKTNIYMLSSSFKNESIEILDNTITYYNNILLSIPPSIKQKIAVKTAIFR